MREEELRRRVKEATVEILRKAETELPEDVMRALRKAYEEETSEIARIQLKAMIENAELARKLRRPMCQDTGTPIFFVRIGASLSLPLSVLREIEAGIRDGVEEATAKIPLRGNIVHPFTRMPRAKTPEVKVPRAKNERICGGFCVDCVDCVNCEISGELTRKSETDAEEEARGGEGSEGEREERREKRRESNVGKGVPHMHFCVSEDVDGIELTVMPKGGGSENVSAFRIFPPLKGEEAFEALKDFVVDSVLNAGGKPCPPTIIGIGVGGSTDVAMTLAKFALLRPVGERNEEVASLETEILDAVNRTGIGPMGLGGRTTALDVHIELADCHITSLPVAINFQCWAARRASVTLKF